MKTFFLFASLFFSFFTAQSNEGLNSYPSPIHDQENPFSTIVENLSIFDENPFSTDEEDFSIFDEKFLNELLEESPSPENSPDYKEHTLITKNKQKLKKIERKKIVTAYLKTRKPLQTRELKDLLQNPPSAFHCLESNCKVKHTKPFETKEGLRSHISKICPNQAGKFKFHCVYCNKERSAASKSVAVSHAIKCLKNKN
jgi:hypothetical protein